VSHDPLRCVVCDTRFVTDPWRERPLIPAVTYPDVCGIACKLNALEPPRVLSNGGSWALYELYAALVTGPRELDRDRGDARQERAAATAERARLLDIIERQGEQVKLLTDQRDDAAAERRRRWWWFWGGRSP
jgi:hypothetical protein